MLACLRKVCLPSHVLPTLYALSVYDGAILCVEILIYRLILFTFVPPVRGSRSSL
jgi:hypothetical protein